MNEIIFSMTDKYFLRYLHHVGCSLFNCLHRRRCCVSSVFVLGVWMSTYVIYVNDKVDGDQSNLMIFTE